MNTTLGVYLDDFIDKKGDVSRSDRILRHSSSEGDLFPEQSISAERKASGFQITMPALQCNTFAPFSYDIRMECGLGLFLTDAKRK